mgnify:CR=1 FL=1
MVFCSSFNDCVAVRALILHAECNILGSFHVVWRSFTIRGGARNGLHKSWRLQSFVPDVWERRVDTTVKVQTHANFARIPSVIRSDFQIWSTDSQRFHNSAYRYPITCATFTRLRGDSGCTGAARSFPEVFQGICGSRADVGRLVRWQQWLEIGLHLYICDHAVLLDYVVGTLTARKDCRTEQG